MHINKKILSITLILSLHGTALCMEEASLQKDVERKTQMKDLENNLQEDGTLLIAKYLTLFIYSSDHKKENLTTVGNWLTKKSEAISVAYWYSFIAKITQHIIPEPNETKPQQIIREVVTKEFTEIAYSFKPNQDYPTALGDICKKIKKTKN